MEAVFQSRYGSLTDCPKCKSPAKFYRLRTRKCYECGSCNHKIFPLSGTIMHGSNTPLSQWFYAIYMFSVSKNGVSAKELERALGVTYKCAWSIGHKIRAAMVDGGLEEMLSGTVEVDESLLGGKTRGGKRGWGAENKTCLVGMVERGGRIMVAPVKERNREEIFALIKENIRIGSILNTDEFRAYNTLPDEGYGHCTVNHSKYQWKNGDAHTNSIEGYWSNLKKSIRGTHTFVSPKHLPKYLNEFSFRYNYRKGAVIFDEILKKI